MRAAAVVAVVLMAVAHPALAQDAGDPAENQVGEELRRIREQVEAIAVNVGDPDWGPIVSVAAMGGITLYMIIRQVRHMDRDAEVRKPRLSWSNHGNGHMYKVEKRRGATFLKIKLVNAGHIAALDMRYTLTHTKFDPTNPQEAETWRIGALASNDHTEIPVLRFVPGSKFNERGVSNSLEVDIGYKSVDNERFGLKLAIDYCDGVMDIRESHSGPARGAGGRLLGRLWRRGPRSPAAAAGSPAG